MSENGSAIPQTEKAPPPLAGVGVAAVVVSGIIGWVFIGSLFLTDTSIFGGFLVLWYWAKVEHLAMSKLPATILGALVGIGLAWIMLFGATHYGGAGFAFGLFCLVVAIYLDVIQILPLLFNAATMLLSIIAAAPLVQLRVDWMELTLATIVGGVFFGSYVILVFWIGDRLRQRSR